MEGAQQEPVFTLHHPKSVDYDRRLMGSRNSLLSNQWAKIDRLTVTNVTNCRNPLGSPEVKPFGLNSYPLLWAKTSRLFNIHISLFLTLQIFIHLFLNSGTSTTMSYLIENLIVFAPNTPPFVVFLTGIYRR
jgi:hypothetical protein